MSNRTFIVLFAIVAFGSIAQPAEGATKFERKVQWQIVFQRAWPVNISPEWLSVSTNTVVDRPKCHRKYCTYHFRFDAEGLHGVVLYEETGTVRWHHRKITVYPHHTQEATRIVPPSYASAG